MTEPTYNVKTKIESKKLQEIIFKELKEDEVKKLFSILSRNFIIHEFNVIDNMLVSLPFK